MPKHNRPHSNGHVPPPSEAPNRSRASASFAAPPPEGFTFETLDATFSSVWPYAASPYDHLLDDHSEVFHVPSDEDFPAAESPPLFVDLTGASDEDEVPNPLNIGDESSIDDEGVTFLGFDSFEDVDDFAAQHNQHQTSQQASLLRFFSFFPEAPLAPPPSTRRRSRPLAQELQSFAFSSVAAEQAATHRRRPFPGQLSRSQSREFAPFAFLAPQDHGSLTYEDLLRISDAVGDVRKKSAAASQIEQLPKLRFAALRPVPPRSSALRPSDGNCDAASTPETCAICIEEFKRASMCKQMPCRHFFHSKCLDRWLRQNGTCPVCREGLQPFPVV